MVEPELVSFYMVSGDDGHVRFSSDDLRLVTSGAGFRASPVR